EALDRDIGRVGGDRAIDETERGVLHVPGSGGEDAGRNLGNVAAVEGQFAAENGDGSRVVEGHLGGEERGGAAAGAVDRAVIEERGGAGGDQRRDAGEVDRPVVGHQEGGDRERAAAP